MNAPPPTRLHIDPPMSAWHAEPRNGRTKPVVATGHQPTLWHPGILAKDIAAQAFANHVGGSAIHVVVNHDTLGPPTLDLPTLHGDRLAADRYALGTPASTIARPANTEPAIDVDQTANRLHQFADMDVPPFVEAGLHRLAEAYQEAGRNQPSQAEQTTAVIDALRQPLIGEMPTRNASTLINQRFVDRLLDDPAGCAAAYNRAALAYPEAGIRTLYAGRDSVELPLWAQHTGERTPVFADLGDSKPQLFTQGQSLDLAGSDILPYLRPRAITLSAIMRSEHCDLFIHGKGGGVYDQVTERWWQDWTDEALAPKAVVSADVYLPFHAPVATKAERDRAVWFDHHLPFNVDRFEEAGDDVEAALYREKRSLLDHMNDDRDKRRRAKAFERIHAINGELGVLHRTKLEHAARQAKQAKVGITNARIASRRDWCFALYPEEVLQALSDDISSCLDASPR